MKINFEQELMDTEGEPILENRLRKDFAGNQPTNTDYFLAKVTLFDVTKAAVYAEPREGEPPYTFEEKMRQYKLILFISKTKGHVELPSEDVAYIKEKIKKYMHPAVMGAALIAIEPDAKL